MNKRLIKSNIVLWSIVLIISVAAFITAYSKKTNKLPYFIFNLPSIVSLSSINSSEFVVMKEKIISKNILDISIDWISGNVNIFESEDSKIKVVQLAGEKFPSDELLSYSIDGDKLSIIDGRKNKNTRILNLNNINNVTNLEIYVPKKEFDNIKINTISSNIISDSIKAKNLVISTTSGNVEITGDFLETDIKTISGKTIASKLNVESIVLDTVSGGASFSGNFEKINIITISGNVEVESLIMLKELKSSAVSGNVIIKIPENDGFTVSFSKVSGELKSDFPLNSNIGVGRHTSNGASGDRYAYKNGGARYSATSISGDFRIYKK